MVQFFKVIILVFFLVSAGCKKNNADPEPDTGEYSGSFRWDFQYGTDGFSNSTGEQCTSERGCLLWSQTPDSYLTGPEQLNIPAGKWQTVELRLSGTAATLKLFWKKKGETNLQTVSIPLIADGQSHDYQIELGQNDHWTGTIHQLLFQTESNGQIAIDFIRLTGLYLVTFPGLSSHFETDRAQLNELKNFFSEADKSVVIGFSAHTEYLVTNDNGDYLYYRYRDENAAGLLNPHYLVRLAKTTRMPVMIWLRGDPWGDVSDNTQLFADDRHLMWTAEITAQPAYRDNRSGYRYLCLAQEEVDGTTPLYWQQTDKLLGQCAEEVGKLIRENPDYILGVTTTSEYKFNAENQTVDLDYNPKTIREFRDYCQQKYVTLSALNNLCGTDFATFELRSSDFNPLTVEAENGFDAPRTRGVPAAFWKEWKTFRAQQIHKAVRRQVDCIAQHIDGKYIYTHQIASEDDPIASPAFCGNVEGANVGIDLFTHEATESTIREISSFVKSQPYRSWGIPEWLVLRDGNPEQTVQAMKLMRKYGVKYLTPFCWGFGDEFDIKGSPAFDAVRKYLKDY